jgi:hypothetical protein
MEDAQNMEVYGKEHETPQDAIRELEQYFAFYNGQRLHQVLDYQ